LPECLHSRMLAAADRGLFRASANLRAINGIQETDCASCLLQRKERWLVAAHGLGT
jgi:hypothetical protein